MSDKNCSSELGWSFRISSEIDHPFCQDSQAGQVAAMFGLAGGHRETLFDDFRLKISPGQIVAVIGPSGAGKSVLLRQVRALAGEAAGLDELPACETHRPAVELLCGGSIKERLAMLSRCGLAEATVLVTPAGLLSGGQQYRLALARVLHEAKISAKPRLIVADEFCSTLDVATAAVLCRQMRKLIRRSQLALLVAAPRVELLDALCPDNVIVKPMGNPPRLIDNVARRRRAARRRWADRGVSLPDPRKWPISQGRLADYRKLEQYHYITGPPACNKRVYVIRTPARLQRNGGSEIAAVLVVSPPVIGVRGRNIATFRRYVDRDRRAGLGRLNAEVETISRVVVHPAFRGCGLAVRLVRHAIRTSPMSIVEALAAMGKIHPLFARAGMQTVGLFKGPSQYYQYYIARK